MFIVWMILGGTIAISLYALILAGRDDMSREKELLQQIKRMQEDFDQERKGFGLMIRIKEEEIERLKEALRGKE